MFEHVYASCRSTNLSFKAVSPASFQDRFRLAKAIAARKTVLEHRLEDRKHTNCRDGFLQLNHLKRLDQTRSRARLQSFDALSFACCKSV